ILMAPLQQWWQAQMAAGQYQTQVTWWMAIRLLQQRLTLQATLHCQVQAQFQQTSQHLWLRWMMC
ncbi:hypothetical protein QUV16_22510, partial [Xanthomonas citri pv. citri]